MSYKDVVTDIEKNQLKKVYLLHGGEMYLKDIIISKIKQKYLDSSFETLNYTHIDGKSTNYEKIINACETLPFMSEKKIVVVEDSELFKSKNKSKETDIEDDETQENSADEISDYILNIGETTCLIFINKDEKIDNRKRIVKNIKKTGRIIELDKLKGIDLEKWASKQFNKYNKSIDNNEVAYFLQTTSYLDRGSIKTLHDLENEISKVISYLGTRDRVTKEDIEKIAPKNLGNDIFKLVEFIGQKDTSMAISIFNDMLTVGEPIQLIIHMIIRQVRLIYMTKLLKEKGYGIGDIGKKINVYHNFLVQKLISQASNFTEKELLNGLKKCKDTDELIKTGKVDGKLAMEILIVEFSQKIA